MRVKDLMSTGICCVRPDTSVIEVARQMRKTDVGAIPVCNDKGELLGIVTDRDIVIRFLALAAAGNGSTSAGGAGSSFSASGAGSASSSGAGTNATGASVSAERALHSVRASDIMSKNIISAPEGMNIHDAALLLSHHQIRRLPVTSGGRLVGMLTTADIARRPIMADEAGDILQAVSRPAQS